MFTFAIWDDRKKKLLIGRDRLGIKPLYYRMHGGDLYFGSELKCLLAVPGFDRRINHPSSVRIFFLQVRPRSHDYI